MPGHRAVGKIDGAGLAIQRSPPSHFEVRTKARPRILGLTGYDGIGNVRILLGAERRIRPADDHVATALAEALTNLKLPWELHGHPADANHIGRLVPRN